MSHDRELPDAQCIGDSRDISRRRCHIPAWVRSRSAVPGPVVRHPSDAALGGGREERFGRLTKVRRAVVPEDGKLCSRGIRADVVNMQPATVTQREITFAQEDCGVGRDRPSGNGVAPNALAPGATANALPTWTQAVSVTAPVS